MYKCAGVAHPSVEARDGVGLPGTRLPVGEDRRGGAHLEPKAVSASGFVCGVPRGES